MSANDYYFIDNWRVEGNLKEVADILEDALSLSTWWPSVYFKPIIDKLSFLLKPMFRSNHSWTMKRGEESLKLELMRRRAQTPEEALLVPAPPRPSLVVRLLQLNRNQVSGGKPPSLP